MSRRALLAAFGAIVVADVACAPADADDTSVWLSSALSHESSLARDLPRFLHLSVLLTGFEELGLRVGAKYLESLQADEGRAADLERLYARAGYGSGRPPHSLEELEARGVFQEPAFRALTDRIVTNWYTGIYETSAGNQLATYTGALAWHVDSITPQTVRGGPPGFWSKAPVIR